MTEVRERADLPGGMPCEDCEQGLSSCCLEPDPIISGGLAGEPLEVDLFGDVVEPERPDRTSGSGRSDGQKRTERQAKLIQLGQHPLMTGPLHPEADPSAHRTDGKNLPFRCGSCVHRVTRGHGAKTFPKCDLTPMSHSEASDVRAWWPACPSYQPIPKENPPS